MKGIGFRVVLWVLAMNLLMIATLTPTVGAQEDTTSAKPTVEDLGNQRYRIGRIVINKAENSFSVPGVVLELGSPEDPLEFLAVAKGGFKSYESALMMEADAVEFNLACILIGLQGKNTVRPQYHFDPAPVQGDPVTLWITWQQNGETVQRPALDLIRVADPSAPSEDWVYTGSRFFEDGRYAASVSGTLIGFVHDPESIIQHRTGLGLGNYGAATYNHGDGPAPGTPVTLIVERHTN
jgi:hypothetical protein